MDISDPLYGRDIKSAQVGEGIWRKLSQLLGEFFKNFPAQNRIFLTFQNCGILDLPHFCISQYDKYSSKNYTVLYMHVEVMICPSEGSPERLMISQIPSIGGTSNHTRWRKHSQLLGKVMQKPSFSKQDIPNIQKLLHIGPSTCLYFSI